MDYVFSTLGLAMSVNYLGYIALILFVALLLRAAIGFGDGLVAVPLLTLFIELREAVPLLIGLSTTISFMALWKDRHYLQVGSLKRTTVAALLGVPLGVMLLSLGSEHVVKGLLGILLISMATWKLLPNSGYRLQGHGWSYFFGGLAGMLGSAYALRGIVFTIYGGLRGWSQTQFKSTISGFYILSGVLIPVGYFSAGLVTPRLVGLYLLFLPLAWLATLVGNRLTGSMNAELFQKVIWAFLLLFGVVLAGRLLWTGS
ncbi:sulfite exporter TauE/SafE family protein [Oceanimonas sp. CHS3-5]|uniref:sulfite exporter TauE/SafE family protein n=1 Tax=Oceanimonas sp. CHS3-5 TaxID=3068186 RepID=UPI00273E7124|nr:sulfite exporter TauE/SafE family protein [Oceanimonas sp. CHS3-5]MDP5292978.1 sulfite exporter TauE/SafE family protein [Oceanimonas sp. CHS3-5]